jgi:hypothetical protein
MNRVVRDSCMPGDEGHFQGAPPSEIVSSWVDMTCLHRMRPFYVDINLIAWGQPCPSTGRVRPLENQGMERRRGSKHVDPSGSSTLCP